MSNLSICYETGVYNEFKKELTNWLLSYMSRLQVCLDRS